MIDLPVPRTKVVSDEVLWRSRLPPLKNGL